jgi:hypothetical protein
LALSSVGAETRTGTTDGPGYTTYLFGAGAFAKGVAPLDSAPLQGRFDTAGVEIARVPLDSDTVLTGREFNHPTSGAKSIGSRETSRIFLGT